MAGDALLPERLYQYLTSVSLREPPILQRLREETALLPNSRMQIAPEQGQFMTLLVQLLNARRAIEVGVFTGYSALAVAMALPSNGRLVACDINEEYTTVAQRYWKEAGVDRVVDLRLNPALQTLEELVAAGESNSFDFAFIDADKTNYENYYEYALKLVRPGGLIMADNVLWSGRVADPANQEKDTLAIRAFNRKLHADSRINLSMIPLGDGFTLALKR